ncbi:MAG: hypothetical protein IPK67_04390 [Planctomycetes bacterium]|nr:hypothetical protein [Planctomycetota bacterium]
MFASAILLSAGVLATRPIQGPVAGSETAEVSPAAAPEAPGVMGVFEREVRVRLLAADPHGAAESLARALAAASERAPGAPAHKARETGAALEALDVLDALDALGRAFEVRPELDPAPWIGALEALTDSKHPNLRAGAWRVLAAVSRAPDHGALTDGATTWEERLEFARARARAAGRSPARPASNLELAVLSRDGDPRVALAALAEGLQSAGRDDELFARAWMDAFERARARGDDSAIELLPLVELAPRGGELARRVTELAAARRGVDPDGWRALEVLALACQARQGVALDSARLDHFADGWHAAARRQPGARVLLARAARALGPAVGERLARRALESGRTEDELHDFLEGAVEALDAGSLVRLCAPAALLRPEIARALFEGLRGRVEAWDAEALAPWLDRRLDAEQRARIVLIVAETFRQNGDVESARFLERALEDPDPDVAAMAFQGLAGAADPTPWMERLHRAWKGQPLAWREARLGDLSRGLAWTSFRNDLLELASQSRSAGARAAELLAPFRGDREVVGALVEWLEQDLGRIRDHAPRRPGEELPQELQASALSLVRALAIVGESEAVPILQRALEASRGRSLELGKSCIAYLGRSERGRRGLGDWLAPSVPSRLRAEAALALAVDGGRGNQAAALHVLLTDYSRYDETLRTRALRVFGASEDAASGERLFEVARAGGSGAAEVLAAVECAGLRARRDTELRERLFHWLGESALDPELRTLTISALVRTGAPDVLARLMERLRSLGGAGNAAATLATDGRAGLERAFERETLIASLASSGDPAVVAAFDPATVFEAPLLRAASDFRARARGETLAEAEFVARAELELLGAFARSGRLAEALARAAGEGAGGWRGLDARLLLECAARAQGLEREALATAAQIGLLGESAVEDTPRVRFEARRLSLEAARERGDDLAFAARGARLLADVRTGAVPTWIFARAFGDFDPRRGIDGLARLACEVGLARARLALSAGDLDGARRELALARASQGSSSAAAAELALLVRENPALGN